MSFLDLFRKKKPLEAESDETRLISDFLKDGPRNVEKMIEYFNSRQDPFIMKSQDVFFNRFKGEIRVEDDHFGFEVKINRGPMVDCNPAYYGLTYEEGKRLFNAILSCVPGSTYYQEKLEARRVREGTLVKKEPDPESNCIYKYPYHRCD